MKYSINITRKAQKELSKIPIEFQEKIISAIRDLSDNPYPVGCKKLAGREAWRIRCGNYRIIYEINKDNSGILVVLIGHRKEIYRGF